MLSLETVVHYALSPLNQKHFLTVSLTFDQLDRTPQTAAYLEVGSGIPVLMLHGFMGDSTCWQPLMEKLQSHCHCISLDLMGFGQSTKPMIRYNIAKEVAFVRQVVEALHLEPCYILGHSFGGWVATAYALQYPNAVRGLILAAAAGIRDDSFCGRYDHLRPLLWPTPVVDWVLKFASPLARLTQQQATLEKISWFRQELMAQPAARSFLLDRMRPEDAIDTVEKQIHRLRLPTLVVTGDRDETIPLWHSQTYGSEIPTAEFALIPEADHALPQNYSAEMSALILPFLNPSLAGVERQFIQQVL